jgi:hypothetical protein
MKTAPAGYRFRAEAARYVRERHGIPCEPTYLAKLACIGGGPVYQRLDGRWAIYPEQSLDEWAQSRISKPLRKAADVPLLRRAA